MEKDLQETINEITKPLVDQYNEGLITKREALGNIINKLANIWSHQPE